MRLSTKIPLLVFVACLLAGAVGSIFLAAGLASEVRVSFERRSAGLLRSLAATVASLMSHTPPDDLALQQAIDNLEDFGHGAAHGIEWLAFADCDGRVIAHSDPRRFHTPLHEVASGWLACAADETSDPAAPDALPSTLERSADRLLLAVPVALETRVGTAVASFSLTDVRRAEARGRREAFLAAIGLAAVLAVVLSLALRFTVARRLSRLTADTQALRSGDLDRRSQEVGGDEVGHLAGAFNAMADRIARHARSLEDEVRARTHELEEANRELARLATTDALTGLLNRRRMHEVLSSALEHHRRKGRTLSVVMVDLDHFKLFNDAHGHLAGDDLLRALGRRLASRKRAADSAARVSRPPADVAFGVPDGQAARYGGEEFLLILPETSKADALLVAERVRRGMAEEPIVAPDGSPAGVTLSAGVASFPEDAETLDELVKAADDALYVAKRQGRNRVLAAPASAPRTTETPAPHREEP